MFSFRYNLMDDGEFVYGCNDFDEILERYMEHALERGEDHECQILQVLVGAM